MAKAQGRKAAAKVKGAGIAHGSGQRTGQHGGQRASQDVGKHTRQRGGKGTDNHAGKPARTRKVAAEVRRGAILEAALAEFAERGFAAARLDDVAARAGVAKGTLYLYFRSKEALFEALIRDAISPLLEHVGKVAAAPDLPPIKALEAFFALFQSDVLGTDRKLLLRLIISEGVRFPALAEIYYREVVTRGLGLVRGLAERAAKDGAFATAGPARHPQLVVAPLVLAIIWDALFGRIDPLDVGAFLRAHLDVLKGTSRDVLKGDALKRDVHKGKGRKGSP